MKKLYSTLVLMCVIFLININFTQSETYHRKYHNIDKIFKPYLEDINKLVGNKLTNFDKSVNINLAKLQYSTRKKKKKDEKTQVGLCHLFILGKNEIEIDIKFWKELGYNERLALLTHELTHCMCKFDHIDKIMYDKCPESIMSPTMPSLDCIIRHRAFYIEGIKKICK